MATSIKKIAGILNTDGIELHTHSLIDDANLISYYQFEGNSNDHEGTNNGSDTSVTYGTSYGKFAQGASYNGTSSYTSLGTMGGLGASLDTGTFTLGFWFKSTYTAAIKQFGVINDGSNTLLGLNFNRDQNDNYIANYITLAIRGEGATKYNIARVRAKVFDGAWQFLCIVFTPSTHAYQWYVNGYAATTILRNTDDITDTANFNHNFCLGAIDNRGTVGGFIECNLDDFFIFNKGLTAAEVAQLYRNVRRVSGISLTVPIASGGGINYADDNDLVHEFNASGTFTPAVVGVKNAYIVVGGGGGGGYDAGGGGGGGGVLENAVAGALTYDKLLTGAASVTVGDGGAAGASGSTRGTAGGASAFDDISVTGGGGGGSAHNTGGNGGSGGGGGHNNAAAGSGTLYQGNNGGAGDLSQGGGGGGWGGAGIAGGGGSDGGIGWWTIITGEFFWFGGGGGGGDGATLGGDADGVSGGGNGGDVTAVGQNAWDAYGGGGGGGGGAGYSTAGDGGNGKVVVRYHNTNVKKLLGVTNL